MTTFTKRQWIDQALRNLHVLPANATATAAQVATVDRAVDAVVEMLETQELCSIPDVEAIDAKIFYPSSVFLADAVKYEFGDVELNTTEAEALLRRVTSNGPSYRQAEHADGDI